MKLKNNDPGKIWAKSDKRFKSYDQKVHFWAKKRYFWNRLGTGPITRFPGTRIFEITRFWLPGVNLRTLQGRTPQWIWSRFGLPFK